MRSRWGSSGRRFLGGMLLALAAVTGAARDARAEPSQKGFTRHRSAAAASADEATATPAPPRHWYGWQILTADGSAVGLVLLDHALTGGEPTPALGLGFFISPILHALHENPGGAAGSLGLRAVLPFVGGLIGMEASNCGFLSGECKGLDVGVAIGFALAVLIDASWLAWEEDDTPARQARGLRPALSIRRGGGWFGVAGAL